MADMIPIKAVYNLGNSVGLAEFTATDTIPAARVSGLGTAAAKNIPATGNASATEVVYGTDTRLSDARTPLPQPVMMNPSTIQTDTTIPSGYNAYSAGPVLAIGEGVTVTINDNANWSII